MAWVKKHRLLSRYQRLLLFLFAPVASFVLVWIVFSVFTRNSVWDNIVGLLSTPRSDIYLAGGLNLSLLIAVVGYVWVDYRLHKHPLKSEVQSASYTPLQHIKVVSIPLIKQRRNEIAYSLGQGTSSMLAAVAALAVLTSQLAYAAPPTLTTNTADSITATTARLKASISSSGTSNLTVRGFQYGETASYGSLVSDTTSDSYAYAYKWGSVGSGNGQFASPEGIAKDSAGNAYVVDNSNHRIQKFTSTGNFISKWGSFGFGNGQFNFPHGIAIDADDNVYVADTSNNRVQKFNTSGGHLDTFGSLGSGNGQLIAPSGLTIDSVGNIYVADANNNRIQKFTNDGTYISKWGSSGSGNGQFKNPYSIDIDSNNNIFVGDLSNHRVQKFTSNGAFITKWGTFGTGNGQFRNTAGVTLDANGYVYVADNQNHRIQKFTNSGVFITSFGSQGNEDDQLNFPSEIFTDNVGGVYIADTGNHRVLKITPVMGIGDYEFVVTGLNCATTYHYRAFSENADETGYGADATFTTANCGTPIVSTIDATNILREVALIKGEILDVGISDVSERGFDIGTTESYGTNIAQDTDAPYAAGEFEHIMIPLDCGTVYNYRAYATNLEGTTYGANTQFVTQNCPVAPTATTIAATNITRTSAILNANISDGGSASINTRAFEYGLTTSYGQFLAESGEGPFLTGDYNLQLNGLTCGTVYNFRALVANSDADSVGANQSFTTSACPVVPTVSTVGSTNVTATSVTLNGAVNADGTAAVTERGFQYGTSLSYGTTVQMQSSGLLPGEFIASVQSLQCGTTYFYRAFATSQDGTGYGQPIQVSTSSCPVVITPTVEPPAPPATISDITLTQTLLTPKPILKDQTVTFRLTITNQGPNPYPIKGYLYNLMPSEFVYVSFSTTANESCRIEPSDSNYARTHFGTRNIVFCDITGETLGVGAKLDMTLSGAASENFANGTNNRSYYADYSGNEVASALALQAALNANRNLFDTDSNNASTYTYTINSSQQEIQDDENEITSENPQSRPKPTPGTLDGRPGGRSGFVAASVEALGDSINRVIWAAPAPLLQALPVALLSALLLLALLYCYRSINDYRTLQSLRRSTKRMKHTNQALDSYLSIISHHINTPTAILGSGLELFISLKQVSASNVSRLQSAISKLDQHAKTLVEHAGQLSKRVEKETEQVSKTVQFASEPKWKAFWIPAIALVAIAAVVNALIWQAERFNKPGLQLAVQALIVVLAIILFGLNLRSRKYIRSATLASNKSMQAEKQSIDGRRAFIQEAVEVLAADEQSIRLQSKDVEKLPQSAAYLGGLNKLAAIVHSMQKVQLLTLIKHNTTKSHDLAGTARTEISNIEKQAQAKKIKVTSNLPATLKLPISPEELSQLLNSTLGNAIKFSKQGGSVDVSIKRRIGLTEIVIKDKGIGIPKDRMNALFEPFSRATGVMQYDYEGLGLNLYLNKLIVNKVGGSYDIESHHGKGTKVIISLPHRH